MGGKTILRNFNEDKKKRVKDILKTLPINIIYDAFTIIEYAPEMDTKRKIENAAKYNKESKIFYLSPEAFAVDEKFTDGNKYMTILEHVILHEVGHYLDEKYKISDTDGWRKLSGWTQQPTAGKVKLNLKDGDGEVWYYDKGVDFPRWYAKRSPADDFAETFAFYKGGLLNRVPENKQKFMKLLSEKIKIE